MTKPYTIYRSSAGSGKTRTLAKEYIKLALRFQADYYKHILAVTFANKASQEMKERILLYLREFAIGKENNLTPEILSELNFSPDQLKQRSEAVLASILHHYSQFAISTIDSFFQRVIRSFTREAGLLGNFRLEVDNDVVMEEVIKDLLDELGTNEQLTRWVVRFAREQLAEGDSWNIYFSLLKFSTEIFKEDFKAIQHSLLQSADHNLYNDILTTLRREETSFLAAMQSMAKAAMQIVEANGITKDDFSYGDLGTAFAYFSVFASGNYQKVGKRIRDAATDVRSWAKKGRNYQRLLTLAESQLQAILVNMLAYHDAHYPRYKSSVEIQKNFYAFALISDISRKLQSYKQENNIMLLSDAPQFLNGVINNSDTPFVYEKVGSFFRNYLIDEFQDTSSLQWLNFFPLVKDAGDQNYRSLLVGDVKQSIYRWRGGDLTLLQHKVPHQLAPERTAIFPLNTNYRSAGNIVNFNNKFFAKCSELIKERLQASLPEEVFADVQQQLSNFPDQGFVDVQFLEGDDDEGWTDKALAQLPGWLEQLQDKGASLKDIAILVRTNRHGQHIANYLLQFRSSPAAKPGYRYEVVSNESLRLDAAKSVSIIVSAMMYLNNTNDAVARGQLAYELASDRLTTDVIFTAAGKNVLSEVFPEEFLLQYHHYKRLSLFELVEELIRVFHLGESGEEMAYLQAFQDLVLEFSFREKTDIDAFLQWWELNKEKKSIQVSASVDAVNIITIHKAKGLQFKFVIIPFCDWKLDHDVQPLMWVTAEEKPLSDLGPLAIKYSSSLSDTFFQNHYKEEHIKVHVDNLNILYVAFTRAEEGLIVMAPTPGKEFRSVADLVYESLSGNGLNGWRYQLGKLGLLQSRSNTNAIEAVRLQRYPSSDWRSKLVIKRQGNEYFRTAPTTQRTKINRGILLHSVLSRIHYKSETEQALEAYFLTNAISEEDQRNVRMQITQIMQHKLMGTWFSKEWRVKTEVPILLPRGGTHRLDRVMFQHNRTVIIDYKTGERKDEDRQQLEVYAAVLTQMGYINVEAWLLYLGDMTVVEVVSKSSLSLF